MRIPILACCAWLICCASALQAETYCSLIVKIMDHRSEEVWLPVTVEDREGRRIEKKADDYTRGGVEFCDLGLSPVTVTVGWSNCHQVTIRNVPLRWETRPYRLSVIYDEQACSGGIIRNYCRFLFRFV